MSGTGATDKETKRQRVYKNERQAACHTSWGWERTLLQTKEIKRLRKQLLFICEWGRPPGAPSNHQLWGPANQRARSSCSGNNWIIPRRHARKRASSCNLMRVSANAGVCTCGELCNSMRTRRWSLVIGALMTWGACFVPLSKDLV